MMRMFIPLLLAMLLAFTSQSIAVARGASAATGQLVLCTGSGPVAVYTDAHGQPTSAPHICPDAALNVLVDVAFPDVQVPWEVIKPHVKRVVVCEAVSRTLRETPPSRGPPLTV